MKKPKPRQLRTLRRHLEAMLHAEAIAAFLDGPARLRALEKAFILSNGIKEAYVRLGLTPPAAVSKPKPYLRELFRDYQTMGVMVAQNAVGWDYVQAHYASTLT